MGMKVLIVEDDCIIQMFLEKVISDMGCNIVGLADNSDDGLQMVAKHSPYHTNGYWHRREKRRN